MIPCTFISALLCLCLIAATSSAGLIVLAGFYGFFSGTIVSISNTVIVQLSAHTRDKIGTRLGQLYGTASFAMLIGKFGLFLLLPPLKYANFVIAGTPVGGVVLNNHGYTSLWIFAGVFIASAGFGIIASRKYYKGLGLMIKA